MKLLTLIFLLPLMTESSTAQSFDHSLYTAVLKRHVKGDKVDYKSLKSDKDFQTYLDLLSKANPDALPTREEKIAFWINAYNAFTLKLIVDNYPVKSITDLSALGKLTAFIGDSPWKREFFSINGKKMSLDKIEHEILRQTFKEERIHFAVNCASSSCPVLRPEAYTAESLNHQLNEQAKQFLKDTLRNRIDLKSKTIYISKIFDWYQSDFTKSAGSLEKFLAEYVDDESIKRMLLNKEFKIEYMDYDWRLNEAK
ncbi:MAG: DUF547 domain-containing protein [Chloroherpetonaceae bacterium]